VGGAAGGLLLQYGGYTGVFLLSAGVALVWLLVAGSMREPRYLASYLLNVGTVDLQQARRLAMDLTRVRGVAEAVVIAEDGVAYLKVDHHALDEAALATYASAEPGTAN